MIDLTWLCEETLKRNECAQNRVLHPNRIARWASTDDLRKGDTTRPSPCIRIAIRWLVFP